MVARIKPSRIGAGFSDLVKPTDISKDELRFSFKYLQLSNPKYCVNSQEVKYFLKFLERLFDISKCPIIQLKMGTYGKTLRFHPIDFGDPCVSEDGFTSLPSAFVPIAEENAWQFSISSNEHGRVHGFIIGDVFFVVWLDPDHNLYPRT